MKRTILLSSAIALLLTACAKNNTEKRKEEVYSNPKLVAIIMAQGINNKKFEMGVFNGIVLENIDATAMGRTVNINSKILNSEKDLKEDNLQVKNSLELEFCEKDVKLRKFIDNGLIMKYNILNLKKETPNVIVVGKERCEEIDKMIGK